MTEVGGLGGQKAGGGDGRGDGPGGGGGWCCCGLCGRGSMAGLETQPLASLTHLPLV